MNKKIKLSYSHLFQDVLIWSLALPSGVQHLATSTQLKSTKFHNMHCMLSWNFNKKISERSNKIDDDLISIPTPFIWEVKG